LPTPIHGVCRIAALRDNATCRFRDKCLENSAKIDANAFLTISLIESIVFSVRFSFNFDTHLILFIIDTINSTNYDTSRRLEKRAATICG